MPIDKEVLLERIRYLRDVQRSLESGLKEAIAIAIASPVINIFLRSPRVFLCISIAMMSFAIYSLFTIYKLQKEIRCIWGELMRRDPWYEKVPHIAIFALIACVASIVALLLTW